MTLEDYWKSHQGNNRSRKAVVKPLCDAVGIDYDYFRNIVSGTVTPSHLVAVKICAATGVSIDSFNHGKEVEQCPAGSNWFDVICRQKVAIVGPQSNPRHSWMNKFYDLPA